MTYGGTKPVIVVKVKPGSKPIQPIAPDRKAAAIAHVKQFTKK